MTFTLEFPFPTVHISANDRLHWRKKAALTKTWRDATCVYAHKAGWKDLPPSTVRFAFAGVLVRDPHNMGPTEKACLDGLVDAGFWSDDDWKHVAVYPAEIIRKRRPLAERVVTITITEREPS
ncbi:MAG: hypothetical protein WC054_05490 [Candidatus Nanopelagicales bacterium]